MKKIVYKWMDGFDGGAVSENFDTEEEARVDMLNHIDTGIRLTKNELNKLQSDCEAFVSLLEIELDEDGEEIESSREQIDSIELSEETIYIY